MSVQVDIPRDGRAPARARQAIERLGDSVDAGLIADMTLLVSELVTNSVKYGSEAEVRLRIDAPVAGGVRVEVMDQGEGFVPRARRRAATQAGGWGLHLVDRLTDRWGVRDGAGHVWFEIDRR